MVDEEEEDEEFSSAMRAQDRSSEDDGPTGDLAEQDKAGAPTSIVAQGKARERNVMVCQKLLYNYGHHRNVIGF